MDYFIALISQLHREANEALKLCYFLDEETTTDLSAIDINLNDPK